jgi:DNA-binding NtrC family response regulator
VDVVGEWLSACDGSGVRLATLAGHVTAAAWQRLAERAREQELAVVRITEVPGRWSPSWRRVARACASLILRDTAALPAADEALRWLALATCDLRIAGVVSVRDARFPWPGIHTWSRAARTVDAHPRLGQVAEALSGLSAPRSASRSDPRAWLACAGSASKESGRLEPGSAIRASEARGWASLRDGGGRAATGIALGVLRHWMARGAADAATCAAVALAGSLTSLGRLIEAERVSVCAGIAATLVGRHRAAAAAALERVERAREGALAEAWGGWTDGGCESSRGGTPVVDDVIEVVQACHNAEDEPAIARVCSVVRERLGATAVAVVACGQRSPLAGAGRAPFASDELIRRVLGTAAAIDPTPGLAGVEAAMPVRFAEAPVGALCCRWAADARPDADRARALMAAAAAACAPNLRALLDRVHAAPPSSETLGLLGTSDAIARVREAIRRAATVPFPVLVEGESGSGKELVASAIHEASARRKHRLCAVNCAAISDELFEAELFGHARGAFTGALGERAGLFEEADRGTLLLDEVGELSPRGQAKLLRVLQEGEVRRVGENVPRRIDVRVVAASNRPLAQEVAARRFRDDLRFRLDVVRIAIPPLRERREDIPVLLAHFWRLALARTNGRAQLDEETVDLLRRYNWPGNVREVQNLTATLAVRAPMRGRVRPSDLPLSVISATPKASTLDEARRCFDVAFVRDALARCGGCRSEAARQLGMTRQGLGKLMDRLDMLPRSRERS